LTRQVYETTEPLEIEERLGVEPHVLRLGDKLGYAQVVFAAAPALARPDNRDAIRTFLGGLYQGWWVGRGGII
jgi:hypothetical protein